MRGLPWVVAAVVVLGMGCGDSQGPDPTINVAGDWLFSYSLPIPEIDGTCSAIDIPVTFQQHDHTLTGTFAEFERPCSGPDLADFPTLTVPAGQIADGTVDATEVTFHVNGAAWSGSGNSSSLSGTFVAHLFGVGPGGNSVTITRAGAWTAVRP